MPCMLFYCEMLAGIPINVCAVAHWKSSGAHGAYDNGDQNEIELLFIWNVHV
jgi:hypothetical protein